MTESLHDVLARGIKKALRDLGVDLVGCAPELLTGHVIKELRAAALVGATAEVGQCGNASPGNGRYHPCGISNFCSLPAGHAGWHQEDQARWGKHWSDDDADGRAVDAVKGTLKAAADKLDRQAKAHGESIVDYTDLLRVWADDDTRWGQGR